MDLGLKYEELRCYSCILNVNIRREETQEAIVSDALPDIGTVVAVTASPLLSASRAEPGSVTCEGEIRGNVLYAPEGSGEIQVISLRIPFHCSADGSGIDADCRIHVAPRLTAVDVKVMNPRKVMLQAEISVHFMAFAQQELRYSEGVASQVPGIQVKLEPMCCQYISQVAEKSFPFEDTASLSASHRSVDRILCCDVTPYCSEAKIVGSKLSFQGGIKARVRYVTTEGELVGEELDLPVAQVLDGGSSSEEAAATVSLSVADAAVELLDRDSLNFSMELYACAIILDRKELNLLRDAYSTQHPCTCKVQSGETVSLEDHSVTIQPFRQSLDIDLPAAEIVDHTAVLAELIQGGGDEESTRCRLKVCVCLREKGGRLVRVEQNCYIALTLPRGAGRSCTVSAQLLESACVTSAGGIELRGNFLVRYAVVKHVRCSCLEQITLEESVLPGGEQMPSAVLRMLREGETLWDLGKEYYSTVEDILAVNQISDESAAGGRFLLIPRNR